MIFYSHTTTPRLRYILDFISNEIMGSAFVFIENIEFFKKAEGPKINYSNERISENECWVKPHSLLFEKGIQQQTVECFEYTGHPAFFKTTGDFPFDIFAASFYLLSRYEEYLPFQKDIYGRYAYQNSLAYKANFLNIPLVNIWLIYLKEKLKQQFPSFAARHLSFTFLPTYDIDEAYSYKYKGWKRSAGGAIKNILSGQFKKFEARRKVLNNQLPDPFDTYEWLDNLHRAYQLKPSYFFLVAEKNGRYDKNILPSQSALLHLIRHHAEHYKIGVHPSWQSGDRPELVRKEIETIEKMIKLKIISSRQHFIRFTLPETFRRLINAGVKEDFSMGYGSINGFRASVASSFIWYDLEKEQTTYLKLFPFCYMEANSFFEQQFSAEQAKEELYHYYRMVKKVNGLFITIWHNTFLGTDQKFKGWRDLYEMFIKEVTSSENNR